MIHIYKYAHVYILHHDYSVDSEVLGKVINLYLQNNIDKDLTIGRCAEVENFIIVSPYADLRGSLLYSVIIETFSALDIEYEYKEEELPEEYFDLLEDYLPYYSLRRGTQHGGRVEDDRGVEDGVQPLVEVFNEYPGLGTFASCEGHQESPLYIAFYVDTMSNFDFFTKQLDKWLEETWKKYSLRNSGFQVDLFYDYGHWKHMEGVYFEFRMSYPSERHKKLFTVVKDLARNMQVGLASVGRGASLEN